MQLVVHPAAARELESALRWSRTAYGERTSERFRRAVERAGHLLLREPFLGTAASAEIRWLPLPRFPYTLVYRIELPVIHVLAVMHQSRKPDYWMGR